MASHAVEPTNLTPPRPSADEGWELALQSFGSAQDLYAEYGGGEAWLRSERHAWSAERSR